MQNSEVIYPQDISRLSSAGCYAVLHFPLGRTSILSICFLFSFDSFCRMQAYLAYLFVPLQRQDNMSKYDQVVRHSLHSRSVAMVVFSSFFLIYFYSLSDIFKKLTQTV
jgi:hypothetical protein